MTAIRRRDRLREQVTASLPAQLIAGVGLQYIDVARAMVREGLLLVRRAVTDQVQQVVEHQGPPSCGPACAACCHGAVPVSALEVERLRAVTTPEIRERARAMAALDDDDPTLPMTPCPALHPRLLTCLVYEERPIVCRGHVSWGPRADCRPGGPGVTTPPALPGLVIALLHATEAEHGAPLILHDVLAADPDVE